MIETVSYLDEVSFTFHHIIYYTEQHMQRHRNRTMPTELDVCPGTTLFTDESVVTITQSSFTDLENHWRVLHSKHSSEIFILSTTFKSNDIYYQNDILYVANNSKINLYGCRFEQYKGAVDAITPSVLLVTDSVLSIINSIFIDNSRVLTAGNTSLRISQCGLIHNYGRLFSVIDGRVSIDRCNFINNIAKSGAFDEVISTESTKWLSIKHNKFRNNQVFFDIVGIYFSTDMEVTSNEFITNIAVFDIYVSSDCEQGLSLSLGSSRCLQCPKHWYQNLIGIIVAAFIAGVILVIIIFALNMTIAIGTLNGILFYCNVIIANRYAFFTSFSSPNFVTIFISWINLDIGFDVCFFEGMDGSAKAMIQLLFPAYIFLLVIIIIILSECSSKFARLAGKGNPVAVLTTMILLSNSKFFDAVIRSVSLLYLQPAHGSSNLDIIKLDQLQHTNPVFGIEKIGYVLLTFGPVILLLGVLYTTLVFFWQWLLFYSDKPIFKWVRYQKLCLFMEPHHAPYISKHRYWTGLLLFARILLFLERVLNFSKNPQIDLMAIVITVTCLLFLKSIISKRIYKNWLVDALENVIFLNLIVLAMLTWYCLNPGAQMKQSAVTYTSVSITFILFLLIVTFHALRYTNCPFIHSLFTKVSSKLSDKQEIENNAAMPEELDGYQLERAVDPTVTRTVLEIQEPLLVS